MKLFRSLPLLAALSAASALAGSITFNGSDANGHSASVTFTTSGSNLLVSLSNTGSAAATVPTDILTAVFFSIPGGVNLAPGSATVQNNSFVVDCSGAACPTLGDVGGEWAYAQGLSAHGANAGISSTGLGLFGEPNLFGGTNLQGPASPDGVQYGIAPSGYNFALANGGLQGSAEIVNTVSFVLSGLGPNFDVKSISGVVFQYGTSLTEPTIPGTPGQPPAIPEPATFATLGSALVAAALLRRRLA